MPARAEIVLEGFIHPQQGTPDPAPPGAPPRPSKGASAAWEHALEGPYGDHTGYYNEQEWFPVLTVERITLRRDAIYHSTYTGKPPDEPAVLGVALNEVFVRCCRSSSPRSPISICRPKAAATGWRSCR